jgi:hypothetical protein
MKNPFTHWQSPRLIGWAVAAGLLLAGLAALAPQQAPVVLYKFVLVILGAVLAYWVDRSLFPYARPHELLPDDWPMGMACLRRALVLLACVLGLTLGL